MSCERELVVGESESRTNHEWVQSDFIMAGTAPSACHEDYGDAELKSNFERLTKAL